MSDPYRKEATPEETFSYCIGRPWPQDSHANPNGTAICIYPRGTQVHHGTMQEAEALRTLVENRTGYRTFIYRLEIVEPPPT